MNDKSYDVIMAGGGVMGCATAFYLLRSDPTLKVAIIEMDSTYEKNSTVLSDGNTRLQFNLKENIQISQYGLDKLTTFSEEMAVDGIKARIGFRQEGNLFLSDQDNIKNAQAGLAMQQSLGCNVEWLTPDEISDRFPLYNKESFAGGTFGPLDGTMDSHAVLMGFKNKAIDLGATFIEAEITEFTQSAGQITGVKLSSGEIIKAKYVLNSAGAWATRLAQTVGIELPIDPIMRQVFIVEIAAQPEEIYPLTVFPSGLYLIQEHENRFMISKSMDDDLIGFDFSTNRERFTEFLWEELVGYAPAFDRLKITGAWAGLYAVNTFDGNAILGEWPTLKGFILANGFSGHGFQQCHAVGRYLAELILGNPHKLDLSIFSPQRIFGNKPVFEGHGKLV
ncbi:MAG: FAD-binding oxidoreductase [Anaerolineales bacterium]|uniref:FAD-binding oxidoreductase n=1 Tax=Candidatus Desulfolinea nitratireducens TaxID=2841698 RepID=A0A8J6THD8_9CHLR|nr:FAD-binding oxidoreductase [Candidatus Desulfolinea nitratireducens]